MILITGANGFIGKNLICRLENLGYDGIETLSHIDDDEVIKDKCSRADFVVHLAGVNRPVSQASYWTGNADFTKTLIECLSSTGSGVPVILSSSTQAVLDNAYGLSKREAEKIVDNYGKKAGVRVYIYRMPNVFGKWSRPNYNSAIATFCHNIANGLPITVNDVAHRMRLLYIDDIVTEFVEKIEENRTGKLAYLKREDPVEPIKSPVYEATLGHVADIIGSFGDLRKTLDLPDMSDPLTSKLYSTYLSFLPKGDFSYKLDMKTDERGSFTEFLRTRLSGQVSVNIAHPGITKGQHWHDSKNEKFLVVSGEGLIRLRKIGEDDITECPVSGSRMEVVEIPTGYTHSIINTGDCDLVTVMWANEAFDPSKPDTWHLEV